jgi:hypothetical protein
MRLVFSAILLSSVILAAGPSRADNRATVIADCQTALKSSASAGYSIRVVSGGYTPGMQAYIHALPSTNSKTKDATFAAALNVKYGVKPMNNTVEMVIVSDQSGATFQLEINKAKTTGGDFTATLQKSEIGGTKLALQDMVCMMAAAPAPAACDDSKKPAACPGGGGVSCVGGQWQCPPLPHR